MNLPNGTPLLCILTVSASHHLYDAWQPPLVCCIPAPCQLTPLTVQCSAAADKGHQAGGWPEGSPRAPGQGAQGHEAEGKEKAEGHGNEVEEAAQGHVQGQAGTQLCYVGATASLSWSTSNRQSRASLSQAWNRRHSGMAVVSGDCFHSGQCGLVFCHVCLTPAHAPCDRAANAAAADPLVWFLRFSRLAAQSQEVLGRRGFQ